MNIQPLQDQFEKLPTGWQTVMISTLGSLIFILITWLLSLAWSKKVNKMHEHHNKSEHSHDVSDEDRVQSVEIGHSQFAQPITSEDETTTIPTIINHARLFNKPEETDDEPVLSIFTASGLGRQEHSTWGTSARRSVPTPSRYRR